MARLEVGYFEYGASLFDPLYLGLCCVLVTYCGSGPVVT